MKTAAWLTLVYGILILIGGIIGYVKAGSPPSLYMGIAFGVLLAVSALGMFKGMLPFAYGAIVLTFLLFAFFAYRFFSTWQLFPPGGLAIVSLTILVDLIRLMFYKK